MTKGIIQDWFNKQRAGYSMACIDAKDIKELIAEIKKQKDLRNSLPLEVLIGDQKERCIKCNVIIKEADPDA